MQRIKKKIISMNIDTGPYTGFVDEIIHMAQSGEPSFVCLVNVHFTIEAYDDPVFAEGTNRANLVLADGVPLLKAMKLLYGFKQERVAGMDLLPDLLLEAEKKEVPVYFFGGSQSMLDNTELYLKKQYPGIKQATYYSPPFRALTEEENDEIIDNMNKSGAGLIFVVLGCPKQDKWMAENSGKVKACMIGVGGALPVLIGDQKRAPLWMQKASLEWFYRFCQEPKRLFKRYFYTNTKFLWLLNKAYFRKVFRKA